MDQATFWRRAYLLLAGLILLNFLGTTLLGGARSLSAFDWFSLAAVLLVQAGRGWWGPGVRTTDL